MDRHIINTSTPKSHDTRTFKWIAGNLQLKFPLTHKSSIDYFNTSRADLVHHTACSTLWCRTFWASVSVARDAALYSSIRPAEPVRLTVGDTSVSPASALEISQQTGAGCAVNITWSMTCIEFYLLCNVRISLCKNQEIFNKNKK